jgi:glutamate N-acetyltransferase/amino-acid N-acetyltransferase
MPQLARNLSEEGLPRFARAICTTDTFPKLAFAQGRVNGRTVTVAGAAKGAGMIAPQMATMLAFAFTDAAVERGFLRSAWRGVVEHTFNRITVDGDTSTNDTALVLASGAAGNALLTRPGSRGAAAFTDLLRRVAGDLAEMIARDGEGATRLVEIEVTGAASDTEAAKIARRIAESPLVKTALYGADPNWGRIFCAIGNACPKVAPDSVDLRIGDALLVRRGREVAGAEKLAREVMREKRYAIRVVMRAGKGSARMLTCDLTEGYIRVNAHYRS